jgi:hypothetical protein
MGLHGGWTIEPFPQRRRHDRKADTTGSIEPFPRRSRVGICLSRKRRALTERLAHVEQDLSTTPMSEVDQRIDRLRNAPLRWDMRSDDEVDAVGDLLLRSPNY